MSRTVVDLDDEALSLASEELGTTSKVATVNAALRRVANQRAAARMLELLDETGTDLSDEGFQALLAAVAKLGTSEAAQRLKVFAETLTDDEEQKKDKP